MYVLNIISVSLFLPQLSGMRSAGSYFIIVCVLPGSTPFSTMSYNGKRTDGQADTTKLIFPFRKFAKSASKWNYKVVQIWPGLIVCKQVTVCPGHIWTTLYNTKFSLKMSSLLHAFSFQISSKTEVNNTALSKDIHSYKWHRTSTLSPDSAVPKPVFSNSPQFKCLTSCWRHTCK
jgi:hypothetical protein